mgnify:CR=1 FL=1
MFLHILEPAALASSLSVDSFAAGFAYGSNKIKVPFSSVGIISFICSGIVAVSMLLGSYVKKYIPTWLTTVLCFSILFIMGLTKLIDCLMKSFIRRHTNLKKQVEFSAFSLRFILSLYADPEEADIDKSKSISKAEAASLALGLSLDGLAVGFGAAMGNANGLLVFLWSLITNTVFLSGGCRIGAKIARKAPFNFAWVGGIILILLAFMKIFI